MVVAAGDDLTAAILNALTNGSIVFGSTAGSSNQSMGAAADIAGTSQNVVTTVANTKWIAFGIFDVSQSGTWATFVGELLVGGVSQSGLANMKVERGMALQVWTGTIATATTTVFKLRGAQTGGATMSTNGTHTKLIVVQFAP
jgi:hypothetical protein